MSVVDLCDFQRRDRCTTTRTQHAQAQHPKYNMHLAVSALNAEIASGGSVTCVSSCDVLRSCTIHACIVYVCIWYATFRCLLSATGERHERPRNPHSEGSANLILRFCRCCCCGSCSVACSVSLFDRRLHSYQPQATSIFTASVYANAQIRTRYAQAQHGIWCG